LWVVYGRVGLRLLVDHYFAYVCLRVRPIELLHLKLATLVEVDRLLVQGEWRTEAVDLADDALSSVALVDDDDVVGGRGPERHPLGREGLRGPVIAAVRLVQDPLLVEVGEHPGRVLG